MHIAFFVDADQEIGMGHLYRSLALAKEFKAKDAEVVFISPSLFVKKIVDNTFDVISTSRYTHKNYENEIIRILKEYSVSIAFFDLLETSLEKHRFIASSGIFIASISSFEYRFERFEAITFFPDAKPLPYSTINGTTVIFSGPKYLIFRDEFENVNLKSTDNKIPRLFISTGALDSFELLPMIIQAIIKLPIEVECYVIMSSEAKTRETVYELIQHSSKKITVLESVTNISEYMAQSDIGIINGGTTRYELALLGIPFIAISIHQTQFEITQRVIDNDKGINLGIKSEIDIYDIIRAITSLLENHQLRNSMSQKLKSLFDMHGKSRIVEQTMKSYRQFNEKNDKT
jgi:spore coat polysaccharide biosynthesis predicted glycosyltransferase SpsG